jgi:hypothetical protein
MAQTFIKEPCCENFCLRSGGNNNALPQYFSNLNLYVKPIINDNLITNPDNTKYTWNSTISSYESIWEWRGFIRTFQPDNAIPIRLIQSSPWNQGLIWFLQVRNWTNSINQIAQQNDYGILAYYENNFQTINNFPLGNFTANDGVMNPIYTQGPQGPTTVTPLEQLIAVDSRNPISLNPGYCEFIYG